MKKIKILSLTLATLLLAKTTSTNCLFGKQKPVSEAKEDLKFMTKSAVIIISACILGEILSLAILKLTNSDSIYVGIWKRPRNADQRREILILTDPRNSEHRIKFKEGVNCFNKKTEIKWPEDEKGHKLNTENNQEPDAEWKRLQKNKYVENNNKKVEVKKL